MRVLIVEDEPYLAEAVRDGLLLEAIAADRIDDKASGFELCADGYLTKRAWDQNADPFTNAVRITVSALRKQLGEPPRQYS